MPNFNPLNQEDKVMDAKESLLTKYRTHLENLPDTGYYRCTNSRQMGENNWVVEKFYFWFENGSWQYSHYREDMRTMPLTLSEAARLMR